MLIIEEMKTKYKIITDSPEYICNGEKDREYPAVIIKTQYPLLSAHLMLIKSKQIQNLNKYLFPEEVDKS